MVDVIRDNLHPPPSNCPFVTDRNSGMRFLVDSGSRFSTILPTPEEHMKKTPIFWIEYFKGKEYAVYGWRELVVDVGQRQTIKWNFLVADIALPVIGADLLSYYDLALDFKRKTLIEKQSTPVLSEDINVIKSCQPESIVCMEKILRKYLHGNERPLDILMLMHNLISEKCLLNEPWKIFFILLLPPFIQMILFTRFHLSPTIYELATEAEEMFKIFHSGTSHCLRITDKITGLEFLIDSGAMRSLIPRMPNEKLTPLPYTRFVSANQSPVLEYGYKHLTVHLGLDELFPWNFIVADVDVPLIGADFLSHFGLNLKFPINCLPYVNKTATLFSLWNRSRKFSIYHFSNGAHWQFSELG
ncbi:unnamed protein product [Hymenolepis diminuta]|uniref:Peptidase A2 domain-containing protein n=1 Tax=Hymenolepis diminuta TaxID=6216 RepID=A0A564XZV2_HYMDI|nr:unnamed protein product [Hymenolepis diminuta]